MHDPFISISIPTFNSEKTIQNCLYSIFDQKLQEIEVIVVDNNSLDKTEQICKRYDCKFLKVSCSKAEARKRGFYESRGNYILLLDSDMYLEKDLLKEILGLIENSHLDAIVIKEQFPPRSIFHVAKNIEKKCYSNELNIEAPRFYRKNILEKVDWDKIDDGWDEYEIFLEAKATSLKIGFCDKSIYLLEKPVDLWKKLHHCQFLKIYNEKYKGKEVITRQFNFRYRSRLLLKSFRISYPYGFLVFTIKFFEMVSCLIGLALYLSLNHRVFRKPD